MRDKKRIPIVLAEIQKAWEKQPDLRLGQLIVIGSMEAAKQADPFYVEDDALIEGISRALK